MESPSDKKPRFGNRWHFNCFGVAWTVLWIAAMAGGAEYYADPSNGSDANPGSEQQPWATVQYAMRHLVPGDTLYLRQGVYYENVYCAVAGRENAPVTVAAYPGETAILNGGIPEFQTNPADAWVPCEDGAPGEFRSSRAYRNLREVTGRFAESKEGLRSYYHRQDLQATNELYVFTYDNKAQKWERPAPPMYCGPGIWYDKPSGHIHVRLAHTRLNLPGRRDYRGETDPRKVPLVIAPFASVPLTVDQAMHVRFRDLTIRGGGYNTVILRFGIDVAFENLEILAGTYGIRAVNTGPFRMTDSLVRGSIPPWGFRTEDCRFNYVPDRYDPFLPGPSIENNRQFTRLSTHASLVTEGYGEYEVYSAPFNHDWEIAYSEFTDAHDGPYISGHNIRFHHNWVGNMQDDAIYITSPGPGVSDNVHIHDNLITRANVAFGMSPNGSPGSRIYIYRNLVDMREPVPYSRPTPDKLQGDFRATTFLLRHGGGKFIRTESLYFYHNTIVAPNQASYYAHRMMLLSMGHDTRRCFNNLCVYLDRWPQPNLVFGRGYGKDLDLVADGNLHWCPADGTEPPKDFLDVVRTCQGSQANRKQYEPGWAANSLVADPGFKSFGVAVDAENDYRLREGSPAVGKGIALPDDLVDPLRPKAEGRPDIGAIPLGGEFRVGRKGRLVLPLPGNPQP